MTRRKAYYAQCDVCGVYSPASDDSGTLAELLQTLEWTRLGDFDICDLDFASTDPRVAERIKHLGAMTTMERPVQHGSL